MPCHIKHIEIRRMPLMPPPPFCKQLALMEHVEGIMYLAVI